MKNLKDGSDLTIECKTTFNKSTNESEAVPFPVRTYTIKAVEDVRPTIISARDSVGQMILSGGDTADRTIVLTGVASRGQRVEILDNVTAIGEVLADSQNGEWSYTLMGLDALTHIFTAKVLDGSDQTSAPYLIVVIDAKDVLSFWMQLPSGGAGYLPQNGSVLLFSNYVGLSLGFQVVSLAIGTHVVTLSSPMVELQSRTLDIKSPGSRQLGLWGIKLNGPGLYTLNFFGPTGKQITPPFTVTFN
jgi:hypothetical protein